MLMGYVMSHNAQNHALNSRTIQTQVICGQMRSSRFIEIYLLYEKF